MTTTTPTVPLQSSLVAAYEKKEDAEKMHQFLVSKGLKAMLVDLTVQQAENAIPPDFARYQVQVPEADEKAADESALSSDEGILLLQSAIKCPECGSLRIVYPNIPRNFLVSAVMRVMVKMHVLDGQYLCMSCQHEWPPR